MVDCCYGPPNIFRYLLHHYTQVDDKNWMLFQDRIILNFVAKCFSSLIDMKERIRKILFHKIKTVD